MSKSSISSDPWIDKLIRFFKQMSRKKPGVDQADDSGWHETEAEYQKAQAEWLEKVNARKKEQK